MMSGFGVYSSGLGLRLAAVIRLRLFSLCSVDNDDDADGEDRDDDSRIGLIDCKKWGSKPGLQSFRAVRY